MVSSVFVVCCCLSGGGSASACPAPARFHNCRQPPFLPILFCCVVSVMASLNHLVPLPQTQALQTSPCHSSIPRCTPGASSHRACHCMSYIFSELCSPYFLSYPRRPSPGRSLSPALCRGLTVVLLHLAPALWFILHTTPKCSVWNPSAAPCSPIESLQWLSLASRMNFKYFSVSFPRCCLISPPST